MLDWTKPCAICNIDKPASEFHRRSRSADGLQRHCKTCGRFALDGADAKQKQARAEARLHQPAPPPPLWLAPRPAGPVVPAWLIRYDAALMADEVESDTARDDAMEDFRRECLSWVVHTRADDVVDALWDAACDGAVSPFDALTAALFDPWPEDPHDPAYWAAHDLELLAQVHEYSLLERLPDGARPLVQPLLPSYQERPSAAQEAPEPGAAGAAGCAESGAEPDG